MRPIRRTLWALALGLIASAVPARGMADTASAVPVTVDGCDGVDENLVRTMVALEMRVMGGGDGAIRWPAVRVTCTGEQARIELRSTTNATTSDRPLDLTGFPVQARARLLAVEISVLLAPLLEQSAPPTSPA